MILTDREIQMALQTGQIEITPPPKEDAFSSTSLDLTLAEPGDVWRVFKGQPIRPGTKGYDYNHLASRKDRVSLDGYTLNPGAFLLAWTAETITLPISARLAARVEGKSALARLGMGIHITAPTIHAGFKGQLQLEMFNLGPNEILLDVGMRVCQLIFEITFGTPAKGYSGSFSSQTGGS
jgi:dCTP deaminase